MITKQQAIEAHEFHAGECSRVVGSRGGITEKIEVWRRNGQTQTWKTRPDEFRIPVAHGLYAKGQIWHYDAKNVHTAEDCPLRKENQS